MWSVYDIIRKDKYKPFRDYKKSDRHADPNLVVVKVNKTGDSAAIRHERIPR